MTPKTEPAYYAISVVGPDRPGIVAGVSEALFRLGCNIADSSCAMLAGEFAMILIVSHPRPVNQARILETLKPACDALSLTLALRTLHTGEQTRKTPEGEICQITVYGADQPGIVYKVTNALAARKINIMDLQTKLVGTPQQPVYVMLLEATLPDTVTVEETESLLYGLREELGIEIKVRIVTPVEL